MCIHGYLSGKSCKAVSGIIFCYLRRNLTAVCSELCTDSCENRRVQALSAFGTDFTLLSQLFPGRNRRQCKNKYTKECKVNARRIDEALKGNPDGSAPYEEVLSRLRGETDGSVRSLKFACTHGQNTQHTQQAEVSASTAILYC